MQWVFDTRALAVGTAQEVLKRGGEESVLHHRRLRLRPFAGCHRPAVEQALSTIHESHQSAVPGCERHSHARRKFPDIHPPVTEFVCECCERTCFGLRRNIHYHAVAQRTAAETPVYLFIYPRVWSKRVHAYVHRSLAAEYPSGTVHRTLVEIRGEKAVDMGLLSPCRDGIQDDQGPMMLERLFEGGAGEQYVTERVGGKNIS